MQGLFVLEILTPDKRVFKGNVQQTSMPGAKAPFVILHNHAPLISVLQNGKITWIDADGEHAVEISGGFVEVNENMVTACVELI